MDTQNIIYIAIAVASIVVVYFACKLVVWLDTAIIVFLHPRRDDDSRDEKRVYTRSEKDTALFKVDNRCEGTGYFFRCRYKGKDLHGDHWFPHARGGATTQQNLVMLCPKCNRKKSDHVPNHFKTKALERRRKNGKKYRGTTMKKAGEWLPKNYKTSEYYNRKQSLENPRGDII